MAQLGIVLGIVLQCGQPNLTVDTSKLIFGCPAVAIFYDFCCGFDEDSVAEIG